MNDTDKCLAEAIKLTVEGNTDTDLKEWIGESYPAVDAKKILAKIPAFLKKKAYQDKAVVLGFCLEATREIYRNMVKIADYTGALKAIQELEKFSRASAKLEPEGKTEEEGSPQQIGQKATTPELLRIIRAGNG